MIDGRLFKDCDLNLTVNPTADSLCRQNAATLRSCSGCRWRGKQQHLQEGGGVHCGLNLPCQWPPHNNDSARPALHKDLHRLSGWEGPYLLRWVGLLKHSIQGHHLQKAFALFLIMQQQEDKTRPGCVIADTEQVSDENHSPAGSNLAFYDSSPLWRQTEAAAATKPEGASSLPLFVFYRREPCSPVANVKHFPIKADSYDHCLVCVSRQPFTFSALQVWGGGHIMQSSQPVISVEIEPRAKKMHLRHKMTKQYSQIKLSPLEYKHI